MLETTVHEPLSGGRLTHAFVVLLDRGGVEYLALPRGFVIVWKFNFTEILVEFAYLVRKSFLVVDGFVLRSLRTLRAGALATLRTLRAGALALAFSGT